MSTSGLALVVALLAVVNTLALTCAWRREIKRAARSVEGE